MNTVAPCDAVGRTRVRPDLLDALTTTKLHRRRAARTGAGAHGESSFHSLTIIFHRRVDYPQMFGALTQRTRGHLSTIAYPVSVRIGSVAIRSRGTGLTHRVAPSAVAARVGSSRQNDGPGRAGPPLLRARTRTPGRPARSS